MISALSELYAMFVFVCDRKCVRVRVCEDLKICEPACLSAFKRLRKLRVIASCDLRYDMGQRGINLNPFFASIYKIVRIINLVF